MEFHQQALDEIEGARQAGVIKTNLVPFARGIMMAIARGTFTVGHGPKVVAQRTRIKKRLENHENPLTIDTKIQAKGAAFISKIDRARVIPIQPNASIISSE